MPVPASPLSSVQRTLHAVPYESTVPGKPPINITVAPPPPSSARLGIHPLLRPSTSPQPSLSGSITLPKVHHDARRDSGLAPSSSTARESRTSLADIESAPSVRNSPSLPTIKTKLASAPPSPSAKRFRKWSGQKNQTAPTEDEADKPPEVPFVGIMTEIPSISFEDLTSPSKIEFSKRGSMLISGKRANEVSGRIASRRANGHVRGDSRTLRPVQSIASATSSIPIRVLSSDDEMLSQKVRSMYECGTDQDAATTRDRLSGISGQETDEDAIDGTEFEEMPPALLSAKRAYSGPSVRSPSLSNRRASFIQREEQELAGGVEDWQDIKGGDVDRYGFIVPRASTSPRRSTDSVYGSKPEPPRLQRVSTLLQIASETPRSQRNKLSRVPSVNGSTRSASNLQRKPTTREVRPSSSHSSYRSVSSRPSSRMRSAANHLPHNRERRCVDEAGDMLTLPPGLADIAEHANVTAADSMKKKEWEREEKWRKMAKLIKSDKLGGGMVFDFDTKDPKLVQRTWKGIPDRWRATAWHAFLSASAKKMKGSPTDEELIASFNELIDRSSPDDVQIDIDVPRTINSHIMFRRRYRGGQRLLFRVLHCLSLYFPDTGYVQGMAALGATLLCYFDEEMAFVMLVRMWQLRGLDRLYQPGFDGLMEALDEFEKQWLVGGEVAKKLVSYHHSRLRNQAKVRPIDRAWHHPDRVRNPLVPYCIQLFHPIPSSTPCLGCLHASW